MKLKITKNYRDKLLVIIKRSIGLKSIWQVACDGVSLCLLFTLPYHCYAGTTYVPVEIPCSKHFWDAPWVRFEGEPEVQYALITKGIRVNKRAEIEKVVETRTGAYMNRIRTVIKANCIPSSSDMVDISPTDSSFACKPGEGIEVSMFEPNDIDPDRYHYVATLVKTDNKVIELKNIDVATPLRHKKKSSQSELETSLRHRPVYEISDPASW